MTSVQVEHISDVRKKITFEVPQEKVLAVLDAEYHDLKKTIQLKGFRKGKVPLSVLRSYFKDKVQAEASRKIIEETFEPGLQENSITLVSVVKIEPEALNQDKPFKYIAEIEVPPPLELKDYKGLKLKKRVPDVREDLVNLRLEELRDRHARLGPIGEERSVREGDHLVVDIKASVDGQPVGDLTVSDYHLELGRNFYLPGLDSKIEGMNPGQTAHLTLDLPEDFIRKDIAGKTAAFEVMVKEAKERIKPALDDDFARDHGEFETLEDLKESIRKEVRGFLEEETRRDLENQIIEVLIEKHALEVPEALVERQISIIVEEGQRRLIARGVDPVRIPPPTQGQRDQVRPSAEKTVKAGLILKAISEKEGLQVSEKELQEEIARRAEVLEYSPDHLRDELEARNLLHDVRSAILQRKVFDLLKEHAEIEEAAPNEGPPEEKQEVE